MHSTARVAPCLGLHRHSGRGLATCARVPMWIGGKRVPTATRVVGCTPAPTRCVPPVADRRAHPPDRDPGRELPFWSSGPRPKPVTRQRRTAGPQCRLRGEQPQAQAASERARSACQGQEHPQAGVPSPVRAPTQCWVQCVGQARLQPRHPAHRGVHGQLREWVGLAVDEHHLGVAVHQRSVDQLRGPILQGGDTPCVPTGGGE